MRTRRESRTCEVVDVVCNRCGESQKVDVAEKTYADKDTDAGEPYTIPAHVWYREYVTVDHGWGFFSQFFGDDTQLQFQLCERCVSEIVGTFKIAPALVALMDWSRPGFEIVLDFFGGDVRRAHLWYFISNPRWGYYSPAQVIAMRGGDHVLQMIEDAERANETAKLYLERMK